MSFAVVALGFSLLSSDQLVLLARTSFAVTDMMGPQVILVSATSEKVAL